MSSVRRYHNPEIFESLAMNYALGTLHGRARARFETLMDEHFYLKAVTEAYQYRFANLVEVLPEKQPPKRVWSAIEAEIQSTVQEQSELVEEKERAWWHWDFWKGAGMAASMFLAVALVFFSTSTTPTIAAYASVMESPKSNMVAIAKIEKETMQVSVEMKGEMQELPDNMQFALWCFPKSDGKIMMMGTVKGEGMSYMAIDKKAWRTLDTVRSLAVTMEYKDSDLGKGPKGEVLLEGDLMTEMAEE